MLDKFFKISENKLTLKTEILAGSISINRGKSTVAPNATNKS